MRLTGRRVLVGIGLIAFVGLVAVGGTLILQALNPRVSQSEATAVALRQASQMDSGVHGFVVVSAHYDAAPDRVVDGRGNVIYSETHSSCPVLIFQGPAWLCHAPGVWIVYLRAPAQGGFAHHEGYVMVRGDTGTVSSSSSSSTN
jgi:hypothetical protein